MPHTERRDRKERKYPYLYEGIVVDRNEGSRLVRIRIEGITDRTTWAKPMAGALGPGIGLSSVPRKGAEVGIMFVNGEIENPRYIPGNHPSGKHPDDADGGEGTVDNVVLSTESFVVLFEEPNKKLILKTKTQPGCHVEISEADLSIEIKAALGVIIDAAAVEINSAPGQVTINGRKVLANSTPI